jgi:hypothetical protein
MSEAMKKLEAACKNMMDHLLSDVLCEHEARTAKVEAQMQALVQQMPSVGVPVGAAPKNQVATAATPTAIAWPDLLQKPLQEMRAEIERVIDLNVTAAREDERRKVIEWLKNTYWIASEAVKNEMPK